MIYTLVVIAMIAGGSYGSGAGIDVTYKDFNSREACGAAAEQLNSRGNIIPSNNRNGPYRIIAFCVVDAAADGAVGGS